MNREAWHGMERTGYCRFAASCSVRAKGQKTKKTLTFSAW
jgi:hypothetical protein